MREPLEENDFTGKEVLSSSQLRIIELKIIVQETVLYLNALL